VWHDGLVSQPTLAVEVVRAASRRLIGTVDSLAGDSWTRPSSLPGWSIAHVVAHLALNAEAIAGAVAGVTRGERVPQYPSFEARTAGIEELAARGAAVIRGRLLESGGVFEAAVLALPAGLGGAAIELIRGSGRTYPVGAAVITREREVEIHHADIGASLDVGYGPADWPAEFTVRLLDHLTQRYAGPGFRAVAADLGRSWEFGAPEGRPGTGAPGQGASGRGAPGPGGETVTGTGHEIAWWATGRPPYPGTTGPVSDTGALPALGGI
jgi:maleylpyruvate isomerase